MKIKRVVPKNIRIKRLKTRLTKIFNEFIVLRDKGICIQSGRTDNPTCGHLHTSAWHSVKWDEDNCHCQNRDMNFRHEFDFYPYAEAVRRKIGQERYAALYVRAKQAKKWTEQELEAMIEDYSRRLMLLKTGQEIS